MNWFNKNNWLYIVTIGFVALIIFQAYWVYLAYQGEQINYREQVEDMMAETGSLLSENDSAKAAFTTAIAYDNNNQPVPAAIKIKLNTEILKAIDKACVKEHVPNKNFYYGIFRNQHIINREYPCNDCPAKLILTNKPDNISLTRGEISKKHICLSCLYSPEMREIDRRNTHYYEMGFHFVGKADVVLNRMIILIIASFICLLLLGTGFIIITKRYFTEIKLASYKTDFINTLTHEIQTPVFTISVAATVIRNKLSGRPNVSDTLPYLEIINKESHQLKQQSEKILELSALENSEAALSLSIINLADLIESAISSLQLLAEKVQGRITFEKSGEDQSMLLGDPIHIRNILYTLVDNAIKYRKHSLHIIIRLRSDNKNIILSVGDNGIGISKEHLTHVFEKFYRITTDENTKKPGFGLGLSYVKTIVKLHNGIIDMTSVPERAALLSSVSLKPRSRMYSILIAEDHESLGYVLKEYLAMNDFEVTLVANGNDAILAVEKKYYHLCLLDVMLPGSDGFEVAARIKAHYPQVPVIFLTARALKVDKIKGFKLGADDYIIKPVDEEELLLRIRSVIKRVYPSTDNTPAYFLIGRIRFEPANLIIFTEEQKVMLTEKEAQILMTLVQKKGNLIPRKYMLKEIWQENSYFTARTMDVHLTKLRKHLNIDPEVQIINVHGKGFILMCK